MARTLALDIGDRRIGVAVCDELGQLARPLATITRASKREDFERVARLVAELQVERVIAGYPRSLAGEAGPQARRVRRYAQALAAALTVPVELWDERYTTVEAAQRLSDAGRRKPRRCNQRDRGQLDAAAAAVILQDYLDARRARVRQDETNNTEDE